MKNRIIVYTANFGQYDRLRSPWVKSENADYVCFTDKQFKCKGWEVRQIPGGNKDARRSSRKIKVLQEEIFQDYEYSLWIDASSIIAVKPEELIEKYLRDSDIALFNHPKRSCIYKEALKCKKMKLDDPVLIDSQVVAYRQEGYPENNNLTETRVIIRRHTEAIRKLNTLWWSQIEKYSCRDQLSFMYCCWKTGISPNQIPGNPWCTFLLPYCPHKNKWSSCLPSWWFVLLNSPPVNMVHSFLGWSKRVLKK